MVNQRIASCQIELRRADRSPPLADRAKNVGNPADRSFCIRGHENFLIGDMGRRRPLCDKGQLEVINDAVNHGVIRTGVDARQGEMKTAGK